MRPPRLSSNIIFIFNHTCYPCSLPTITHATLAIIHTCYPWSLPTITYATLAHYPRYWNFTCSFFTGGIVCCLLALLITHAIETSPALFSQVASFAASSPCSLPTLLKFHLLFISQVASYAASSPPWWQAVRCALPQLLIAAFSGLCWPSIRGSTGERHVCCDMTMIILLWHDCDHFAVTWLSSFCCDMTMIILLWHDCHHFAVTWLWSF